MVAPLLERFAAGSGVAKRCYLTVIDLAPADTIGCPWRPAQPADHLAV